jgi:hypothetical protein
MTINAIEKKIDKIKVQIGKIGEMRPGSISKQYNVCGMPGCKCKDPVKPKKHGPYYNLSFTFKGKGGTKFIRPVFEKKIKMETNEYRKFKKLTEMWVTLSIELSNLKMEVAKQKIDSIK